MNFVVKTCAINMFIIAQLTHGAQMVQLQSGLHQQISAAVCQHVKASQAVKIEPEPAIYSLQWAKQAFHALRFQGCIEATVAAHYIDKAAPEVYGSSLKNYYAESLVADSVYYDLIGVVTRLKSSVAHYYVYAKIDGTWCFYDDGSWHALSGSIQESIAEGSYPDFSQNSHLFDYVKASNESPFRMLYRARMSTESSASTSSSSEKRKHPAEDGNSVRKSKKYNNALDELVIDIAKTGNLAALKILIGNKNANPNAVDKNGRTPLFYAIEECRVEMAEFLLTIDAVIENINAQDSEDKETPLLFALSKVRDKNDFYDENDVLENDGLLSIINSFLSLNNIDVSICDQYERTALIWSIWLERADLVEKILTLDDSNINAKDTEGTPFDYAIAITSRATRCKILYLLLQHGFIFPGLEELRESNPDVFYDCTTALKFHLT